MGFQEDIEDRQFVGFDSAVQGGVFRIWFQDLEVLRSGFDVGVEKIGQAAAGHCPEGEVSVV